MAILGDGKTLRLKRIKKIFDKTVLEEEQDSKEEIIRGKQRGR